MRTADLLVTVLLLAIQAIPAATFGLIRMSGVGDGTVAGADSLLPRMRMLMAREPATDIIVTPEYALYRSSMHDSVTGADAVVLEPSSYGFTVDTGRSAPGAVAALNAIRAFADTNNVYVFLGTVAEKFYPDPGMYPALPESVLMNTMLIINGDGIIERIDRKTSGSDWIRPSLRWHPVWDPTADDSTIARQAFQLANTTTAVSELVTGDGELIRYLPTICAERNDTGMLATVSGEGADIVIESQMEGDFNMQDAMMRIQEGIVSTDSLRGWEWYMDSTIVKYQRDVYGAVREGGYYLVIHYGYGGMAAFDASPLAAADTTAYYVVATQVVGDTVGNAGGVFDESSDVSPLREAGRKVLIRPGEVCFYGDNILYTLDGRVVSPGRSVVPGVYIRPGE